MAEPEALHVRVAVGWAETTTFVLTPGTKPISVGTQGQWVVFAEGVAPVHLYFAYDGTSVYVAPASPATTVLLAGVPLGPGWATAQVSSEIRFGGATLVLTEAVAKSVIVPSSGPASPNTVSDGGALWEAAQRAVQAAQASTVAAPSAAPAPAAQHAGSLASTIVMVPKAGVVPSLGAQLPGLEALQALDVRGTAPAPSAFPAPAAVAASAAPSIKPPRRSVPPGGAMGPTAMPSETVAAPEWTPSPERRTPAPEEPPPKPGAWAAASGPKKATLLLMPFAVVASYLLLFHDPSQGAFIWSLIPHRTLPFKTALVVDAGAAAPSRGDSPPAAASAPTTSQAETSPAVDAAKKLPPLAPAAPVPPALPSTPQSVVRFGSRTPERAALDDVAAGSFESAARQYEALQAAHPDDPLFRDAARILRLKAARTR